MSSLPTQANPTAIAAGRRQAPRVRLSIPATMILTTGHRRCRIDDLSETGACVSVTGGAPRVGDSAILTMNHIEAFGTVAWQRGTKCGLQFDEPVALQDVIALRALHDRHAMIEAENERRRARDFVEGRKVF